MSTDSTETKTQNVPTADQPQSAAADVTPGSPAEPEFAELQPDSQPSSDQPADLSRLNDVQVTVAAELGRTTVPIHKILKLKEGSVFELNRSIETPVELRAQDVALGNGEVVVVDGNFAIRIQEIYKKEHDA